MLPEVEEEELDIDFDDLELLEWLKDGDEWKVKYIYLYIVAVHTQVLLQYIHTHIVVYIYLYTSITYS